MTTLTPQRRLPLGLFPDNPSPRLYDRIVDVLRVRHYSRRTEEAYLSPEELLPGKFGAC